MQSTDITIEDGRSSLTVSAIYCPPNYRITYDIFYDIFQEFFSVIDTQQEVISTLSTQNRDRDISPTTRGRTLYRVIQDQRLKPISTEEPTYWLTDRNKIPDLIDMFISKGIILKNTSNSVLKSSDHTPVIITLLTNIKTSNPPCYIISKQIGTNSEYQ